MRLVVDLDRDSSPSDGVLDLHTLAGALRSPHLASRLLRAERYDEVEVRSGSLALSGFQAVAQLAVIAARTRVWAVENRRYGRAGFAFRALSAAARAVPREVVQSLSAAAGVVRAGRRAYGLPRQARATAHVLYLRVEPSLRWHGTQVGGAVTHTRGVVTGLLENGVDVDVIAPERPLGTDGAHFTAASPARMLQLVRGLDSADYGHRIVEAARERHADFVYQRYHLGSYAGLEVARRLGVPLVLEFNGPEIWVERHWRSRRLLLERPLEQLERHHLREASLVVVVSKALRDHVVAQGVPAERVLVNPNGVDARELTRYRDRRPAQWRHELGLPDLPTVGFIGTFGLWHGAQLLPAIIAKVPDARWLLIGGGGIYDQVEAEVRARGLADRTTLTGMLPRERALELLACCDVCVSPHVPNPDGTPFFGSPTKLFEYMGLGRSIVASDLDQIGEVIEHEYSGLLCPPADFDAFASAVRRLLADAPLRERLGAAAAERAESVYSWSAHARRILEAVREGTGTHHAVDSVSLR